MPFKGPAYRYIRESDKLPALYATEGKTEALARVKIFDPCGSWTWYVIEYDPIQKLAFGLVDGFEKELGYFSLEELEKTRTRFGLPLERDLHWDPVPVSSLL